MTTSEQTMLAMPKYYFPNWILKQSHNVQVLLFHQIGMDPDVWVYHDTALRYNQILAT